MRYPENAEQDDLGAYPYNDMEDYITGQDGYGVDADVHDPSANDIMIAQMHSEVVTHTITVRYDPRIDVRMIMKYTNQQTGKSRYWWVRTLTNVDFEWHYFRIGAEEIVEFTQ